MVDHSRLGSATSHPERIVPSPAPMRRHGSPIPQQSMPTSSKSNLQHKWHNACGLGSHPRPTSCLPSQLPSSSPLAPQREIPRSSMRPGRPAPAARPGPAARWATPAANRANSNSHLREPRGKSAATAWKGDLYGFTKGGALFTFDVATQTTTLVPMTGAPSYVSFNGAGSTTCAPELWGRVSSTPMNDWPARTFGPVGREPVSGAASATAHLAPGTVSRSVGIARSLQAGRCCTQWVSRRPCPPLSRDQRARPPAKTPP